MMQNNINSNIIYRSQIEDVQLRIIPFQTSTCNIKFYRTYDLTDFDKLICSILMKQDDNTIKLLDLGYLLGFDLEYAPKLNSYKDEAEIALIQRFLHDLKRWGLIQISGITTPSKSDLYAVSSEEINWAEANVVLTLLGQKSILTGRKYAFYEGKVNRLSFFSLVDEENHKVIRFPFFNELGVKAEFYDVKQLAYSDDLASIIDTFESNDLIELLKSQYDNDVIIFNAHDSGYLGLSKTSVDVELYQSEENYTLRFLHNGQECETLNNLYVLEANHHERDKKIEWALYCMLLHDEHAILNYNALHPFEDIIQFNEIIKDSRIDWHDPKLLDFLIEHCDTDGWQLLSEYCSTDVLEELCPQYQDKLNWGNLTLRLSEDFLINNSSVYPWEKDLLTVRHNTSAKLIQHFLVESFSDANKVDEWFKWDWSEVYPFLDKGFIKSHIQEIPFDLTLFTKEIDSDDYDLISLYPNATWSWEYIASEFPESFILKGIDLCWNHCNKNVLLERLFFDNEEVRNESLSSIRLKAVIGESSDTEKSSLCFNTKSYDWTDELIEYFESVGLIKWETEGYKIGFEANPSLDWSEQFFILYNSKIKTNKGFSHVSNQITDLTLVDKFPNFNWEWSILSRRKEVYDNPQFVLAHKQRINKLEVALMCDTSLLEEYFLPLGLMEFMSCHDVIKQRITQAVSIDFVRQNIKLPWDWAQLTRRVYSIMKLNVMGHPTWIDLWDWNFLSQNIELDKIFEYASVYSDRWCWSIIIGRLTSEFLLEDSNLQILAYSIEARPDLEDLWTKITEIFDSNVILDFVNSSDDTNYHWDLGVVYNRPDFDLRKHIEESNANVDWEKLSSSDSLNTLFAKLKKGSTRSLWFRELTQLLTNSNTSWDVKNVTRLSNVIDTPILFTIDIDWDWNFISENATWINLSKDSGSTYFFNQYQSKLSFKLLSKRTDIGLNESVVNQYDKQVEWDWNALVANPAINFSFKFVKKHSDLAWDWGMLSNRDDLTNEILESLIDEEWNWYVVTSHSSFVPTKEIIDKIFSKTKNLNWEQISISQNIGQDVIAAYWEFLDISKIISSHAEIQSLLPIEMIKAHVDDFPWNQYNDAIKESISLEMVHAFGNYLDWRNVSGSQMLPWSESLIKQHAEKWYWSVLNMNPKVRELIPTFETEFASQINIVHFIDRIRKTGHEPYIYHFTHIYNAIDVIRSRKILSRDRALELGLLRFDSAGAVIGRSSAAHPYARFYFRPGTPTQYYNEALGADSKLGKINSKGEWKSKYPKSYGLGLPKCPVPIFFRFDIEEVLSQYQDCCHYSDRNMQSDNPNVYKIITDPEKLGTEYLYKTMDDAYKSAKGLGGYDRETHLYEMNQVMKYSQQEFLIESEFDFSNINSVRIICYDENYASLLKQIFADDPISAKIYTSDDEYRDIFEYENRSLQLRDSERLISLSTDFQDEYYFKIIGNNISDVIFNLSKCDVLLDNGKELKLRGTIIWEKTNVPFDIYFVDPKARTKEWLVYQNGVEDVSSKNRLQFSQPLKDAIVASMEIFSNLPIKVKKDLFYPHMIDSYHGISHTMRVLLYSIILASQNTLTSKDITACAIAAIIHDLGKKDDREGQSHGENSALRCAEMIKPYVSDEILRSRILSAVKYHSIPDDSTPDEIKGDILWKILKDADALDRSRFAGRGCDRTYLRLPIFNSEFGEMLLQFSSILPSITAGLTWDNPADELLNILKKIN